MMGCTESMQMHVSFRRHATCHVIAASLTLLYSSFPAMADAAEFAIGDKLPEFSNLHAVDGTRWDSMKLGDSRVLIVVFTCNRCPYAVEYEDRLNALHAKYSESGKQVRLFVINSNYGPNESLKRMRLRAKEKRFNFPYVKDTDQSVARSLGAVYTPEFFVFDHDGRLVYKGALDDATNSENVKTNYVDDAVSALLAGAPVKTTEIGARGCTIRFRRRRPSPRGP